MKNKILFVVIALTTPFYAISQSYNYAPNMLNIPCLKQKGDAVLGLGWGRGSFFQALEIQGVYSPMNHLAFMANYFGAPEKNVRDQSETGTDFYLWEAAVGAYEKMPKGAATLFAGFGSGNLFSTYAPDRTAAFALQRWFIQPGLSYRSNFFQAGLAIRLSRLVFNNGVVSYSIEAPYLQYIQNIEKDSPMFLPELGIQVGMRLKPLTINLNIASIFPNTDNWNFNRVNTGLSVLLDLSLKGKKS